MKKLLTTILFVLSMSANADDIKIWASASPQETLFTPYLNIPIDVRYRPANDGDVAIKEALEDKNSFLIRNNTSILVAQKYRKNFINPYEVMEPIAIIGDHAYVVAIANDNPANSIEELAKNNKRLKIGGSSSIGTCAVAGKYIEKEYGVKVDYIFYKPGVQSLADLIHGDIDMICRSGTLIASDIEETHKVKPVLKFTNSNDGILKNIPIGIPVNNYTVLFANKSVDPVIKKTLLTALTDQSYIDSIKKYKNQYLNFYTIEDLSILQDETSKYSSYLNHINDNF